MSTLMCGECKGSGWDPIDLMQALKDSLAGTPCRDWRCEGSACEGTRGHVGPHIHGSVMWWHEGLPVSK